MTASLNRRDFLTGSGALVGAVLVTARAAAPAQQPLALRTITYNVLACRGYPRTEANRERLERAQPQMPRRFAQELGLYAPDIVTLQESPSEEKVAEIAEAMGMRYAYFPGGFPGAVITPHPIVESQNCPLLQGPRPRELFTRHWGRATLSIHGKPLTLYSAHLHPSDDEVRAREVTEALAVMATDIDAEKSMLFQGDLNHPPDGPEYARWRQAGLIDALPRAGDPTEQTFPSTAPSTAIDYIWTNAAMAKGRAAARVLFEGAFRTNPDDARSFALSDHLPVLADFRV